MKVFPGDSFSTRHFCLFRQFLRPGGVRVSMALLLAMFVSPLLADADLGVRVFERGAGEQHGEAKAGDQYETGHRCSPPHGKSKGYPPEQVIGKRMTYNAADLILERVPCNRGYGHS